MFVRLSYADVHRMRFMLCTMSVCRRTDHWVGVHPWERGEERREKSRAEEGKRGEGERGGKEERRRGRGKNRGIERPDARIPGLVERFACKLRLRIKKRVNMNYTRIMRS